MEETILRNKKEANGRKWLARHMKTRKTEKQRYPLPPPTSHYSSTLQQRHPKTAIKQEALSTPQPSRSTAQTTPIANPSHLASTATPSIHHSTEKPSPFSTFSPYSSVATKTDRRLKQEHHEHHQELLQELQDGQGSKDLKAKLSLNLFFLCHDSNISAFFYFLCHGKPSGTNSNFSPFPHAL
jgi:hypothetical protein